NRRATTATADAVAGDEAVALGVFLARGGATRKDLAEEVGRRFGYELGKPLDAWRPGYRFTSASALTVPVAFRAFLEAHDHETAIRSAVSVGGDTDTVACMAGALAGAFWGVPQASADAVAAALAAEALEVVVAFEGRFPGG